MNPPERSLIYQIKPLPLFNALAEPDLARIVQEAHTKNTLDGAFYFFQDDPAERLFVLLKGSVKLTQSTPGEEPILLRMIRPVSVFGLVAIVSSEAYPVSAQAFGDSHALYWTTTEFITFADQLPQLSTNAIRMMATQVKEFQERLRHVATERVERRLARTLIRLASQVGKKTDEGILIDLPLTRHDLADMTGTTLYTVSRTLSQWEEQGLVICGRERVVVRYPHGLVSIAEDLPLPPEEIHPDEGV